jgi:hypothetical protein
LTFEAENNVIRVTDSNGDVVFDTATPMPHIAGVLTSTITHTFPESGDAKVRTGFGLVAAGLSGCTELQYVCSQEYVCGYEWVCGFDPVTGKYECNYEYVCGYQEVCNWEYVAVVGYFAYENNKVLAKEHSSTYTIGSVAAGTAPDFLLALITATRTSAGSQQDYGTFVSAIPTGQKISANGSAVLELAFQPDGQPWLSRIVNIYLDGDTVKAQFKHSNRDYLSEKTNYMEDCSTYPSGFAPSDNTSSTWQIAFEVYVGKFTT